MPEALREICENRELLWQLTYRDLKVRYKQTMLGAAWAIFTPVMMMAIFTQVFARMVHMDTQGIPYPLYAYTGLLAWQFFASALKGGLESLVRNSRLVTKIYMPREVFPLSQVLSCLVDFVVASVVLAGIMAWYQFSPSYLALIWVPILLFIQVCFTVGLVLLLSMGYLFYRDVKYIFEVFIMLWMFATSVVYPIPLTGEWATLLALNPMIYLIDGYRDALLLGVTPNLLGLAYSATVGVSLAVLGLYWFHEAEYLFAENI